MSLQSYDELLKACHRPFKYYEHEFNQQKHIYVKIQNTVLRLNSLGVPWDFTVNSVSVVDNPAKTSTNKSQYDAVVSAQLHIEGLGNRGAVGADTNFDKDNAVKSAASYALRKAGSLFGISHYLMVSPKENSALVNFLNNADLTDLSDLKKAVAHVAGIDGMSALELLQKYGVTKDNVTVDSLTRALTEMGRI